jgi:4-hydroxy-2-oxoheptanedioate aldolase
MRSRMLLIVAVTIAAGMGAVPAAAQDVRLNRTVETLERDLPVFGIFTANLSLQNARALATSDLDFLFIDMEHGPYDVETLRTFLLGMVNVRRIAESGSPQMTVTPLVRIPMNGRENLEFIVKQVLDVGAFGVVFPFIETRAAAENAVSSMRYPPRQGDAQPEPRGKRGSSPGNATWFWGVGNYSQRADVWPLDPGGELLAVLQIESREGVENIDEIITVPGVGAIFVGPADLALSYGLPGSAPEVEAAIARVLAACRQHDVPCGITTGSSSVERRLAEGFTFVTIGYWSDAGISTEPGNALEIGRRAGGRND